MPVEKITLTDRITKQIVGLFFLGFLLTAVLVYPYGMMRDNMLLFAEKLILDQPPDNWMGWFTPFSMERPLCPDRPAPCDRFGA